MMYNATRHTIIQLVQCCTCTHAHSHPYVGVVYSDRQILLTGLNLPHGVALHGDFLYWIDNHDLVVQRTNKTDPTNREIIISNLDSPRSIQVYERKPATLSEHCSERLKL